jgi:hypothetical protein
MSRLTRLLLLLALGVALAASPALAQRLNIVPVPPHVKPQWTPLPNNPKIFYAPNVPTDVFRYRGKYYLFWAGTLFKSSKVKGPWTMVLKVPPFFYEIDPAYFKTVKKEPAPEPAPAPAPPMGPGTMAPPEPGQVVPLEPAVPPEPADPSQTSPQIEPQAPATGGPTSSLHLPGPKAM